jgi:hypothetical protein
MGARAFYHPVRLLKNEKFVPMSKTFTDSLKFIGSCGKKQ